VRDADTAAGCDLAALPLKDLQRFSEKRSARMVYKSLTVEGSWRTQRTSAATAPERR